MMRAPVYVGAGMGENSYQLVGAYDPVGGSSNAVNGVLVTVDHDDAGQGCGGV